MGRMMNGCWQSDEGGWASSDGRFHRPETMFHHAIGEAGYPAETGRYHLYVSHACPWAHRTVIFRKIKQLEDIIGLSTVHPDLLDHGWEFRPEPEPLHGFRYLYQLYARADPGYSGRVTVPVLWDRKSETIVNNESSEIIRMFNSAFNHLTGNAEDYYPAPLRAEIDEVNEFVYEHVNNGVYKCGFATTQEAYNEAFDALFGALDELDSRLGGQRYLAGNRITEADWRLFATLIRFDAVYHGHFKCNRQRIFDFPNLSNYLRDLYQQPGISETVHMSHIKRHYYFSHVSINPNRIVPRGPLLDFSAPHDRERFQT
jgi:putative glutathione S-transferase